MTSSIRKFWQQLELSVHPEDAPKFASNRHTFNLDYPPPAFIGDVDNAPVVILMLNGGYDPASTPREFPTSDDMNEHRQWLRGERKEPPTRLSSYYTDQEIFELVLKGEAVIVNACAYRSGRLSGERENRRLADVLPSVKASRRWLRQEVLPAAKRGARLIAVHRWSLWDFEPGSVLPASNVYYSKSPVSPYLPRTTRAAIEDFLCSGR